MIKSRMRTSRCHAGLPLPPEKEEQVEHFAPADPAAAEAIAMRQVGSAGAQGSEINTC